MLTYSVTSLNQLVAMQNSGIDGYVYGRHEHTLAPEVMLCDSKKVTYQTLGESWTKNMITGKMVQTAVGSKDLAAVKTFLKLGVDMGDIKDDVQALQEEYKLKFASFQKMPEDDQKKNGWKTVLTSLYQHHHRLAR